MESDMAIAICVGTLVSPATRGKPQHSCLNLRIQDYRQAMIDGSAVKNPLYV
jgi:hypothetical protein